MLRNWCKCLGLKLSSRLINWNWNLCKKFSQGNIQRSDHYHWWRNVHLVTNNDDLSTKIQLFTPRSQSVPQSFEKYLLQLSWINRGKRSFYGNLWSPNYDLLSRNTVSQQRQTTIIIGNSVVRWYYQYWTFCISSFTQKVDLSFGFFQRLWWMPYQSHSDPQHHQVK